MRGVSRWVSRVAPLLAVFLVLASVAWADEAPPPTDPAWRISPPVGVSAQARISPPGGVTAQHRIEPPVGSTCRIQPPVGAPDQLSLFDRIRSWLQSRLGIPNG